MTARTVLSSVLAIPLALAVIAATPRIASAQTPLPGGFEINLLPGYEHQPLQGIDSIVGRIAKKEGLTITYEFGRIPQGNLRLGGDYSNYALRVPEKDRLWLKEQTIKGRKIHVVYGKDQRLTVSTEATKMGANFTATAKTPGDVADVLLMVFSFAERKEQREDSAR